jgi:hypothetical protein
MFFLALHCCPVLSGGIRLKAKTVLVAVLVLGILVAAPLQAAGEGVATHFTAIDVACPGGNIVLSDEPLIAGPSTVVVTFLDDKKFLVDAVYSPTAYPGSSWIAPGKGHETPTGFIVHHSGTGTGAFEGAKIVFKVEPVAGPVDLPCEPVGPVVTLEGVIIHPPN